MGGCCYHPRNNDNNIPFTPPESLNKVSLKRRSSKHSQIKIEKSHKCYNKHPLEINEIKNLKKSEQNNKIRIRKIKVCSSIDEKLNTWLKREKIKDIMKLTDHQLKKEVFG